MEKSDHPHYRSSFKCERCGERYPTNRSIQKMCRPCRLITNLEYWNEGRTRPQKCSLCEAPMLRSERSSRLCADCHTVPARWFCDCLCCGGTDLLQFAPGVPACKWCVLDPDDGVRTTVTRLLVAWRGDVRQTGGQRGVKPVIDSAAKGSAAAATLRLQIVKVALQKNPTFPRGMDWKQFAVQGQTKRWVAGLDLPPIEPAEPRLRAILEAAIAAPEGWLTRAVK